MIEFLPKISYNNSKVTDCNEELKICICIELTDKRYQMMVKTQKLMKSPKVRNQNKRESQIIGN